MKKERRTQGFYSLPHLSVGHYPAFIPNSQKAQNKIVLYDNTMVLFMTRMNIRCISKVTYGKTWPELRPDETTVYHENIWWTYILHNKRKTSVSKSCYLFCFKAEYPLCCFLTQDWPCSYGFHAFPPRGETESSADHGAGASHPQSTHLQGTAVELIHALYIHLWFKSIPSRNFIVFTLCVLMHRVSIFHQRIWDVKRNTDSLCSSGSLTVCVCLCLCAFIYALVCVCAGPE